MDTEEKANREDEISEKWGNGTRYMIEDLRLLIEKQHKNKK